MQNPLLRPLRILGWLFVSALVVHLHAGIEDNVTYTWTGASNGSGLYNSENWLDELAPPNTPVPLDIDITNLILLFGDSHHTFIEYYELYANQLKFLGNTRGYYLQADIDTTHIGSGGISYSPMGPAISVITHKVQLHAAQTWAINEGKLVIEGYVSDLLANDTTHANYQIEKTGEGILELRGDTATAWAGGLKISGGKVLARASDTGIAIGALGSGTLTFNGGSLGIYEGGYAYSVPGIDTSKYGSAIYLTNNIVSKGEINLHADSALAIVNTTDPDNFIRLDANTTLMAHAKTLTIEKNIIENEVTGPHSLTIDSPAAIILYGNSLWGGGTTVEQGLLIFGGNNDAPNLPGNGTITTHDAGYIGIAQPNDVSDFIGKLDLANSTGAIGFDSDPYDAEMPDTFTEAINLTGANPLLRIGSATEAILGDTTNLANPGAVITPAGTNYRFGGGGGSLFVASHLTGSRGLNLDSHDKTPLTLWLLNPNDNFTGNVFVNNSALIYGSSVTPSFNSSAGLATTVTGYVGTSDKEFGASWLNLFSSSTTGIIGFDVFPGDEAPESWEIADLDTSRFSNAAIGTTSQFTDDNAGQHPGLILTGTIIPNSDGIHRFAAYKGGALDITGTLTGTGLIIGRPDSIATFGDWLQEAISTITISSNNAGHLADGTTFYGGQLLLGHADALGSGALTIMPVNFTGLDDDEAPTPFLGATDDNDLVFDNDIVISAHEINFGGSYDFELAGDISGPGEIYVGDDSESDFALTLSGDNSFSGGVYVGHGSTLNITSNTGTGTGPISFGYSGGHLNFGSTAPVIHGFVYGDNSPATITLENALPTTLTIQQQTAGILSGHIFGTNALIVKDGLGTLLFSQEHIYTNGIVDDQGKPIGLVVNAGTFIMGNGSTLLDQANEDPVPVIKINSGGTFALDGSVELPNPVLINAAGRLAGFGSFTDDISIGNGAILSPGLEGYGMTGSLDFYHLELDPGGILEFDIQSLDSYDTIHVHNPNDLGNTLVINADSAHPFIIRLFSLNADDERGFLDGIDFSNETYEWTLLSFDALDIDGLINDLPNYSFDSARFMIDTVGFNANLSGNFNVALSGQQLVLQFTPVPEPSTYALMALGLGVIAWSLHRRRRRKA